MHKDHIALGVCPIHKDHIAMGVCPMLSLPYCCRWRLPDLNLKICPCAYTGWNCRPWKCLTDLDQCLTDLGNVWQTRTNVWQTLEMFDRPEPMFDRPWKCLTDLHKRLTDLGNVWQTCTNVWQTLEMFDRPARKMFGRLVKHLRPDYLGWGGVLDI